jgi:hypothetical protein
MSEEIKHDRRSFLGTAAATIAAAQLGMVCSADAQSDKKDAADKAEIRPYRFKVPDESLVDLRRRLEATRWPDRETVKDQSQGLQLQTMKKLVGYRGAAPFETRVV